MRNESEEGSKRLRMTCDRNVSRGMYPWRTVMGLALMAGLLGLAGCKSAHYSKVEEEKGPKELADTRRSQLPLSVWASASPLASGSSKRGAC